MTSLSLQNRADLTGNLWFANAAAWNAYWNVVYVDVPDAAVSTRGLVFKADAITNTWTDYSATYGSELRYATVTYLDVAGSGSVDVPTREYVDALATNMTQLRATLSALVSALQTAGVLT